MPDVYTWIAWAVAALAFVVGIQVLGVGGLFVAIVVGLVVLTGAGFMAGERVRRRHERPDPTVRSYAGGLPGPEHRPADAGLR